MVEKALCRERRLAPPQFHGVPGCRVAIGLGERFDGRCERGALSEHEIRAIGPRAIEQHQLQQELGSQVSQMIDWTCQPTLRRGSAASGDSELGPSTGVGPGDQVGLRQPVERPVGEWPTERPDAPELAVRCEPFDDGPPVRGALGDDREACMIGE